MKNEKKYKEQDSRKPELYAKYKIHCIYIEELVGTLTNPKIAFDIYGDFKDNGYKDQDYAFMSLASVKKFFNKMVETNERFIKQGKPNTFKSLEIIKIDTKETKQIKRWF